MTVDLTKHVKPLEQKTPAPQPAKAKVKVDDVPMTPLTAYSYYESGKKYMKVLVTLEGVDLHPAEKFQVTFKPRSLEVIIRDFAGKNYAFRVPKLQNKIQPDQCSHSFKRNTLVLTLRKEKDEDNWWSLYKSKAVCEVDSD